MSYLILILGDFVHGDFVLWDFVQKCFCARGLYPTGCCHRGFSPRFRKIPPNYFLKEFGEFFFCNSWNFFPNIIVHVGESLQNIFFCEAIHYKYYTTFPKIMLTLPYYFFEGIQRIFFLQWLDLVSKHNSSCRGISTKYFFVGQYITSLS